MADPDKVLDRVEKLIRLAAPTSGTTQSERESAALEIVRLICEHNLTLRETPPAEARAVHIARHAWVLTIALQHSGCSSCGGKISPGDRIWARVRPDDIVEFRHNYLKPCTVA